MQAPSVQQVIHPDYEKIKTLVSTLPEELRDSKGRSDWSKIESASFPIPDDGKKRSYSISHETGLVYPKEGEEVFRFITDKITVSLMDSPRYTEYATNGGVVVFQLDSSLIYGGRIQFRTKGKVLENLRGVGVAGETLPKRTLDLLVLAEDLQGKSGCRVLMIGRNGENEIDHFDESKY